MRRSESMLLQRLATATLAAAVLALASCSSGDPGGSQPSEDASSSPSAASTTSSQPTTEPAAVTDIDAAGAKRIEIDGDWLSAGAGSIWLSGANEIYRIDPQTGHTTSTINVPDVPCEASDFGLGHLWSAVCGVPGLVKIDPSTDRIVGKARLDLPDLGNEGSIGVGAGGVWLVVDGSGCTACVVARVDAERLRVTARIPVESGTAAVRFGEGFVWATNPEQDTVFQIDPVKLEVVDTYGVGSEPRFFAVYAGSVWTLDQSSGTITRIVISTGETTSIEAEVIGDGGDLAAGGGWVWARGSGPLLKRIDPRTNEVVETYGPNSGSGAAIVGYGSVWLSAHDISTVWALPSPPS